MRGLWLDAGEEEIEDWSSGEGAAGDDLEECSCGSSGGDGCAVL